MSEATKDDSRPEIYGFLDFRRYLDCWFAAKKLGNPRFSHRLFARLAGQKSPSLLSQVIQGKRNLSPSNVEAFARAMRLSADETSFFTHLVQLGQASTPAEQNKAWERIASSRRFRAARSLEEGGFEFMKRWYYAAVHELARSEDFQQDPAWVAAALRPMITAPKARKALELLASLGMLVTAEDGSVSARDVSIVTPHEVAGLAARNYHAGMLGLAQESMARFPREERHVVGVTVCVPESLVPRLKDELNRMQERLLELCDGADGSCERVYQVQLALFPLSAATEQGGAP